MLLHLPQVEQLIGLFDLSRQLLFHFQPLGLLFFVVPALYLCVQLLAFLIILR